MSFNLLILNRIIKDDPSIIGPHVQNPSNICSSSNTHSFAYQLVTVFGDLSLDILNVGKVQF